jgi:hypothetical protein
MASVSPNTHREGLRAARLLMVLSSISPLFILWAIRGNSLIPDQCFIGFCALMVVVPNAFLWLRIRMAMKQSDKREITVGTADDHRDHILVYLFAMLLPFYSEDLGTWRDLSATVAALAFIVFLFWHLNLHYMNLVFAALGFRVFTVYPPADGNPLTGKTRQALITRRVSLVPGDRIVAYRLSDTVYLEAEA